LQSLVWCHEGRVSKWWSALWWSI